MRKFFRHPSLQVQIIGLVLLVIFLVLIIAGLSFSNILIQSVEQTVGNNVLEFARILSRLPNVQDVLKSKESADLLQTQYEQYLNTTTGDHLAIVVIDQKGIRYIHPNRELIGGHITGGAEGPALEGKSYYSKATGVSGPAIHTYVPITGEDGRQIGVVSIAAFESALSKIATHYIPAIIFWLLIGLSIGIIGSTLLAKRIKKILHGYEPEEISRQFRERESMMECLGEGVIAIDCDSKITLINGAARNMLNLPENLNDMKIMDLFTNPNLAKVMETEQPEQNVELSINNGFYLANSVPIRSKNKIIGAIISFRDISEVRQLAEKLTGVQQYVDGLRAKTHEFMNKLQTISGLLELKEYEEAKEYIISETTTQQRLLNFLNLHIRDPKISGLLLGKIQQAEELNIKISIDPGSHLGRLPENIPCESLILILGNLLQNAIDALKNEVNGEIVLTLLDEQDRIILAVEDNGAGIQEDEIELIFQKGYSTKGFGRGFGLSLVKHHVDYVLRGKLFVNPNEFNGTTFVIEIPKSNLLTDQVAGGKG